MHLVLLHFTRQSYFMWKSFKPVILNDFYANVQRIVILCVPESCRFILLVNKKTIAEWSIFLDAFLPCSPKSFGQENTNLENIAIREYVGFFYSEALPNSRHYKKHNANIDTFLGRIRIQKTSNSQHHVSFTRWKCCALFCFVKEKNLSLSLF